MSKITIMGMGVLGSNLHSYLSDKHEVYGYDPYKEGFSDASVLDNSDWVFICVPTPYTETGFSSIEIEDALAKIHTPTNVVIRSTVLPGSCEYFKSQYPEHRIFFNPEFLREATAYEDLTNPNIQIVGITGPDKEIAESLIAILPKAPKNIVTRAREAEMAKYAINSFLAVKVSFFNQIFDLCEKSNINFEDVRLLVGNDSRITPSHTDVHQDGYRGYGGKCLPKDSKSLLDFADMMQTDLTILRQADYYNNKFGVK